MRFFRMMGDWLGEQHQARLLLIQSRKHIVISTYPPAHPPACLISMAQYSQGVANPTQLSVVSCASQGGPIFEFLWNTPLSDSDLKRTFVGVDVGGDDAFGLEWLSVSVTPDCTGQSRAIATGGRLTASVVGLAFVADGLFYNTSGNNTVEVTGRAAGNSDTVINIPGTVNNGGIT